MKEDPFVTHRIPRLDVLEERVKVLEDRITGLEEAYITVIQKLVGTGSKEKE